MKYPIELIVWEDHTSRTNGWTPHADVAELSVVSSVGFRVRENEKSVVLALSVDDKEFADTMTIHKACILERREFKYALNKRKVKESSKRQHSRVESLGASAETSRGDSNAGSGKEPQKA